MIKKRITAEEKKQIEECKRRENEVKALFDEHDEVYGKKRYMAKVPELLRFLKYKKNAKTFWENPHIKMIYNISDHNNFLLSIYTEETDNRKYKEWLVENFSNPIFGRRYFNFDMILNYYDLYDIDKERLFHFFPNLINILNQCSKDEILEEDMMSDYEDIVSKMNFVKFVPINKLLNRDYYRDVPQIHPNLPRPIRNAKIRLNSANAYLEKLRAKLSEKELDIQIITEFRNLANTSLGQALQSLYDSFSSYEKADSLNADLSDEYNSYFWDFSKYGMYYELLEEHLTILSNVYDSLINEYDLIVKQLPDYKDFVLLVHPLIVMENNFLRIDAYSVWKNVLKKQWTGVINNNPEMFEILDALVKSRGYYLDEINQDKENVGCQE